MNMIEAVKSFYTNYVNFSGRSQRSALWWFVLFNLIVSVVIAMVEGGGSGSMGGGAMAYTYNAGPVGIVWSLVNIIPGIALSIRRLHDLDKSGWWMLIALIPLIGAIILLVWDCQKGTEGPNRFGPDPLSNTADVF